MFHRLIGVVLLSLVFGGFALSSVPTTLACAPAMRRGEEHSVEIASKTALIVWDKKAKKQHFIRRASFHAQVPYFGFLVPTPTQPELAEAPDEVFTQLEDWTRPEVKTDTVSVDRYWNPFLRWLDPGGMWSAGKSDEAAVEEVAHVTVGPYDAVVLKANDLPALSEWLGRHGYDARPALLKWLDPYVKAGWFITAFQMKKEPQARTLTPQAVRMSFTADRPFFPYREAEDQREPGRPAGRRLLRVFFLADQRMQGALDEKTAKWPGKTAWAGRLDNARRQGLAAQLASGVKLPPGAWLTVFDDHASPRPGTSDLFFSPSGDQSEVRRPPIIHYKVVERIPLGEIIGLVILGVLFVGSLLIFWRRRGRRALAG